MKLSGREFDEQAVYKHDTFQAEWNVIIIEILLLGDLLSTRRNVGGCSS